MGLDRFAGRRSEKDCPRLDISEPLCQTSVLVEVEPPPYYSRDSHGERQNWHFGPPPQTPAFDMRRSNHRSVIWMAPCQSVIQNPRGPEQCVAPARKLLIGSRASRNSGSSGKGGLRAVKLSGLYSTDSTDPARRLPAARFRGTFGLSKSEES